MLMAVLEAYAFTLETVAMPFARAYGNASGYLIVILSVPMYLFGSKPLLCELC